MYSINTVCVSGNLTDKPELSVTPTGIPKATFSIGNTLSHLNAKKEQVKQTSFFKIILWGKAGEHAVNNLVKGQAVVVSGILKQERWEKDGEKHSYVDIICKSIIYGRLPQHKDDNPNQEPEGIDDIDNPQQQSKDDE